MSRLYRPAPWAWTPASLEPSWIPIASRLILAASWADDPSLWDPATRHKFTRNGNPTLTLGPYGREIGDMGDTNQILAPNVGLPGAYQFTGAYSWETLIYHSGFGNPPNFLMLMSRGSASGDDIEIYLNKGTTPQRRLSFVHNRGTSGTQGLSQTASPVVPTSAGWQHLAGTWDPATSEGPIYVNGEAVPLAVDTMTPQTSEAASSLRLGHSDNPTFVGDQNWGALIRMAYFRIYRGALTPDQVRLLSQDYWGVERPDFWNPALIAAPADLKGEAILQGVGTVTADGQTSATGAAALTGTGTLTADGTIGIPTGQAALTGTGILVADGTAIVPIVGEADLVGVGILTAKSLPELSILSIRQLLAEGIRQSLHLAGRDDVAVYEYPPETVVVPSVVIMPDEPYWVPSNFGRSPLERIRVNLELQMLTPRLEVSESFNDLERLGGIVLQGTLRVPVVQWTELGQPEGVTVNDIETIMTRASVMAHV